MTREAGKTSSKRLQGVEYLLNRNRFQTLLQLLLNLNFSLLRPTDIRQETYLFGRYIINHVLVNKHYRKTLFIGISSKQFIHSMVGNINSYPLKKADKSFSISIGFHEI